MPLIIPSNSISGEFEVANSLRFDDGSSDYLNRTQGTPTNADKFTLSVWVKRCGLTTGDWHYIASFDGGSNPREHIRFNSTTDQLQWYFRDGSGTATSLTTNRLFRDVSAWYHIVCVYDSTQGTNSNRQKFYINGVQETSFSSSGYVAQNTDSNLNTNSNNIKIGALGVSSPSEGFFDGYMAEYVFIDGQSLDPTSFGEFDEDTGIWKPKAVSGLTFGNNGYYLDFENSGSLGADVSGNGNNFTVNNLTSIDQTTDTCTNNFTTLNPLYRYGNNPTYSQGNLGFSGTGNSWQGANSTFYINTGKWFYEIKINSGTNLSNYYFGWTTAGDYNTSEPYNNGIHYYNSDGGEIYANSIALTTADYGTFGVGDILGLALDYDNSLLSVYKNGTALFTEYDFSSATTTAKGGNYVTPTIAHYGSGDVLFNFGNPPFTISSGNSDGNGFGNFEYAPPTNYFSLCSSNLAEYG